MFGHRSDGTVAKNIDPILRVTNVIMPKRYDAMVNYLLEVKSDGYEKFIEEQREKGYEFTYVHIVIAAILRMYAMRPELNRFVMNTRVYNRKGIEIAFAVKKALRDGADETTVKLHFDGTENIYQVKEKVDEVIKANKGDDKTNGTDKFAKVLLKMPPFLLKFAMWLIRTLDKHGMLPKWALKLSPFHTSSFVTFMKSISTEYVYHHIYDLGTCGMFAGVGKEIVRPEYDDNGELKPTKIMQIGVVIDERICDGLYYAKSIKLIKKFLLNPEQLVENYVYPPKELTKKEQRKANRAKKKLDKKNKKFAKKQLKKQKKEAKKQQKNNK